MYRSDSVGKIILKVLLIVFLFACFFGVIIFWPNISNFINSFFEVEEVEKGDESAIDNLIDSMDDDEEDDGMEDF